MMLRWSLGQPVAAEAIETAVADALIAGYRTADLVAAGGEVEGVTRVGTLAMADAVVAALEMRAAPKVGAVAQAAE
jgi:3-isopropylmalate dehydrogenase